MHITGIHIVDAQASALNAGRGEDGKPTPQKKISVWGAGDFPYVSAQAFRYWARTTLENEFRDRWNPSPVTVKRNGKNIQQIYTVGDPIQYDDDDLFGYMRALKDDTRTRKAPFMTSPLVSIAPVRVVTDFGVMSRGQDEHADGALLPQEHEFYRATLKGMFSVDLRTAGTFTTATKAGRRNLDDDLAKIAEEQGLTYIENFAFQSDAYRLPDDVRARRVAALFQGLAALKGGANQTLHYTDVSASLVMFALTPGANNPFTYVLQAQGPHPRIHAGALNEAVNLVGAEHIYLGLRAGFLPDEDLELLQQAGLHIDHPANVYRRVAQDVLDNPGWMA